MKKINVLSLFDGMSCGQIALQRAGIEVENYFASEIDKHAINVTMANYPNTIQLGDVTKISGIKCDLLIGGSPCQGFSFAGKQLNFEDSRSKLFFEFVRLLNECKPKYFLLENVKMKKEYQDVITSYLGVEPIEINSALVSAQNRRRLYWTNIPNITQPDDKGIMLKDILLDEENQIVAQRGRYKIDGVKQDHKMLVSGLATQTLEFRKDNKSNCLTTVDKDNYVLIVKEATKKGYIEVRDGECFDYTFPNSKTRRGRFMKLKSNCLTAANFDFMLFKDLLIRKLTPIECERLQTVSDDYTKFVSDSQRKRMLGNGWTVDVITHILKNIKHGN